MDKYLGMLGLAKKAGALLVGIDMVLDGVRNSKTKVVVVASDASKNTLKQIKDKCVFYKAEYDIPGCTRAELGAALGRSETSAVAITDKNFYDGYKKACGNVAHDNKSSADRT